MGELEYWDSARSIFSDSTDQPGFEVPIMVDRRINFPLFKATKREFADAFFRNGSLRLGTIWDYRKEEYPLGIADAGEGLCHLICDDGEVSVPVFLNAKDSYIFCVSEDDDRDRFSDAGYDAVYRIDDVRFVAEIAKVLQQTVELEGAGFAKIMYEADDDMAAEITRRLRLGVEAWFAVPPVGYWKNPAEAYQREVRALFSPTTDMNAGRYPEVSTSMTPADVDDHRRLLSLLQPINVQVPGAIQYATPVWNCG